MKKLLNLKHWLTIPDAARHLSILFGEDVSEADVLHLALDGNLKTMLVKGSPRCAKRREHCALVQKVQFVA